MDGCAPARCHGKRGQSETNKFRHITGQTVTFKHYQPDVFQEQWYLTIEAYSWRDLTYHKDRLPAIAAMAKRRERLRPNDQYLAGLWRDTLLCDLLWHVRSLEPANVDNHMQVTPGSRLVIPTWSWANLSVGVTWPRFRSSRPLRSVEVVDVRYKTDGPVVSGDIKEAVIKLRAPLIRLDIMPTDADLVENKAMFEPTPELMAEPFVTKWHWDDHEQRTEHMKRSSPLSLVNGREAVLGVPLFFQDIDTTHMFEDWELQSQVLLMVAKIGKEEYFRRLGTATIALRKANSPPPLDAQSIAQLKTADERHQERFFDWLDNLDSEIITLV